MCSHSGVGYPSWGLPSTSSVRTILMSLLNSPEFTLQRLLCSICTWHASTQLPSIHSVCLPVCLLSTHPVCLPGCLSVRLSICLSGRLSVRLSATLHKLHCMASILHKTAYPGCMVAAYSFLGVCAGTIVFVTVLLLVTKKQQRLSWVLTHYQVQRFCNICLFWQRTYVEKSFITLCIASLDEGANLPPLHSLSTSLDCIQEHSVMSIVNAGCFDLG